MPLREHGLYCDCVACRVDRHRLEVAEKARLHRTGTIEGKPPPLGHGTRACYARGCRLPECVEANRVYARRRRLPDHGTYARYRRGCHCPRCRAASARKRRLQRAKTRTQRVLMGHGTRACYKRGCRRPECVEAFRSYKRALKQRHRERERRNAA